MVYPCKGCTEKDNCEKNKCKKEKNLWKHLCKAGYLYGFM